VVRLGVDENAVEVEDYGGDHTVILVNLGDDWRQPKLECRQSKRRE
jgi:hypothetical protein